jgi:hypothetical protein
LEVKLFVDCHSKYTSGECGLCTAQPLVLAAAVQGLGTWTQNAVSTWVWIGGYLKTASTVPGTSINTQKVISVSVPGYLINLVNPSVVDALDALTTDQTTEINSQGSTWALDNEALQTAVAYSGQRSWSRRYHSVLSHRSLLKTLVSHTK